MGSLLSSLLKNKSAEEVFIDFENCVPTEQEMHIYNKVQDVLAKGAAIKKTLVEYKDGAHYIRKAMTTPSKENEEEALLGLLGCADVVSLMHGLSLELEEIVGPLLESLCVPSEEKKSTLEDQQALALSLARVLDFALAFDAQRINTPAIANDFSFYRRLVGKFPKHEAVKIKDDQASVLTMFTCSINPMVSSVAKASGKVYKENPYVTDALRLMANSCFSMLKGKKFADGSINMLCVRAMVGSIVLFDHTNELGVFVKSSGVLIKDCIKYIKKEYPDQQVLLNCIQFSTVHYNDDSTPSSIQDLFD